MRRTRYEFEGSRRCSVSLGAAGVVVVLGLIISEATVVRRECDGFLSLHALRPKEGVET